MVLIFLTSQNQLQWLEWRNFHTNFSIDATSRENGFNVILKGYLPKLDAAHKENLELYRENTKKKFAGKMKIEHGEIVYWSC